MSWDNFVQNHPTIVVTFVLNKEKPEKSTYLIDFDQELRMREDEWHEFHNKTKLIAMIDNLKTMLPDLMINKDKEFNIVKVKENNNNE